MLNPAQKRFLSAKAHSLSAVVIIGRNGLTSSVINEIDTALKSHELIKIRVASGEKDEREAMLEALCAALHADPVRHVGKILVVYRRAEKPLLVLP